MRGAIVIGGWSAISLVLAFSVLVVFIDPTTGFHVAFAALMAIGFFVSILGRLGPAPMQERPSWPLIADGRSLTRGRGTLTLEESGALRFATTSTSTEAASASNTLNLERPARVRLGMVAFIALALLSIFVPTALMLVLVLTTELDAMAITAIGIAFAVVLTLILIRRVGRAPASRPDLSLDLGPEQIVAIVPFRRLLLGPSIVVGYTAPGTSELCWEEFLLSRPGAVWELPQPTSDPALWARLAPAPTASEGLLRKAEHHRHRLQLREGVALWLAAAGLVGLLLSGVYGTVGLFLGAAPGWLLIAGIITVLIAAVIATLEAATLRVA